MNTIKNFLNKAKFAFMRFMQGRYGADKLGNVLVWGAVILTFLNILFSSPIIYLLSLAMWVFALYRMFSRNFVKRRAENAFFEKYWYKAKTEVSQAIVRFKNRKTYKYFKCPNCHTRMRLPRKVGEVTVNCKKCGNSFKQKA